MNGISGIQRKFFIISLTSHIILGLIFFFFENRSASLKSPFMVYGAYSVKPTHAFFKSARSAKPVSKASQKIQKKMRAQQSKKIFQKKGRQQPLALSLPKVKNANKAPEKKASESLQKVTPVQEKQAVVKNQKSETLRRKQFEKVFEKQADPLQKKEKEKLAKVMKKEAKQQVKEVKEEANLENTQTPSFQVGNDTQGTLQDKKFYFYQQHIQQEVARLWKPPLGVPQGTECVVLFEVDETGNVKNFKITASSNILIYDLSIVKIAKNFHFDCSLWGKEFTITFRQ